MSPYGAPLEGSTVIKSVCATAGRGGLTSWKRPPHSDSLSDSAASGSPRNAWRCSPPHGPERERGRGIGRDRERERERERQGEGEGKRKKERVCETE